MPRIVRGDGRKTDESVETFGGCFPLDVVEGTMGFGGPGGRPWWGDSGYVVVPRGWLGRPRALADNERRGFVARQLVEARMLVTMRVISSSST